jgi:hypothetical protein
VLTPPHLPGLIRERVAAGRYIVGGHVLAHARTEGFAVRDALAAATGGLLVEHFPDRGRCLFAARLRLAGGRFSWLHVVCDYNDPVTVGLVTAYIPDPAEWGHPPLRRR